MSSRENCPGRIYSLGAGRPLDVLFFLHMQVFEVPHRDGQSKAGDVLGREGEGSE